MFHLNLINFIVLQSIIIIVTILLLIYLIKIMIANHYNKKFSAFVSSDTSNIDNSFEACISVIIKHFINAFSYLLDKLKMFKKSRLKYDKYLFTNNYFLTKNIDYISLKLIINLVAIFNAIIFLLFSFSYYNLIIILLFIILINLIVELILNYYINYYYKLLNKELINIIRTVNSSLSVGLNITQALNNAKHNANTLLSRELDIIINDINNGISIEKAFNRLYNRVKSNEVLYLATILSVLSKSGGSIFETFQILEEDYEKKIKRQRTINNLLFPYRFIFNFLGILPLIFFIYKLIINNNLLFSIFNSLYNTSLLVLLIIYNVCYFIIINNLMEVINHE